jgi:hypothetical protein
MRKILLVLFIASAVFCRAQTAVNGDDAVKLISWHATDCDERMDITNLAPRISEIAITDNQLTMTVSFADNCAPHFNPTIKFRNDTLTIDLKGGPIDPKDSLKVMKGAFCDCCFSIQFQISNISDRNFVTIFKGSHPIGIRASERIPIVYSQEPYRIERNKNGIVVPPFNPANPFVGTWKCYKLETFSKKETISDSLKNNFSSIIIFYPDLTYLKITDGIQTKGQYTVTENKLVFYKYNDKNELEQDYSVRWIPGENDPMPQTAGIDFLYPEILPVKSKKGQAVIGNVDVYYKKLN